MVLDQDKEIQNTFSTFSLLWELCNDAQEVFVVLRFHLASVYRTEAKITAKKTAIWSQI